MANVEDPGPIAGDITRELGELAAMGRRPPVAAGPDDFGAQPASALPPAEALPNDDLLLLKGIEAVAKTLEELGNTMVEDALLARSRVLSMADADVADAEHTKAELIQESARHRADAMALIEDRRARAGRVAAALSETRDLLRSRMDAAKAITGRQSS